MERNYYTCENCGFIFTKPGECDQCPDCGKRQVRKSTAKEIEELHNRENTDTE